jgi:ribulose-phosphate 3-epimerase
MKVYPAILTDSISVCQQQINYVSDVNQIEVVQVDVIDGHFADNMTLTPMDLLPVEFGDLKIDFHLMVQEPMDYFYEILEYKDDLPVRGVIGQVERMSHQDKFIKEVKKNGLKPGLSLDLFTPVSALDPAAIKSELELVQLMGVEAGKQGQELQSLLFEQVKDLKKVRARAGKDWEIVVDGGVKLDNIKQLAQAGVEAVGVGSQIWQAEDKQITIQELASYGPDQS